MCTSHSRSLSLSLSVDGEVLRYGPRPGRIVRRLQRRRRLICRRITCPISASRYVTCYSLSYTKGGCSRGCCHQRNLSENAWSLICLVSLMGAARGHRNATQSKADPSLSRLNWYSYFPHIPRQHHAKSVQSRNGNESTHKRRPRCPLHGAAAATPNPRTQNRLQT